jgi:hypothetical protein
MDQAYSKSVMLACAAVILLIFIVGTFSIVKNNINSLNEANAKTSAQLNQELGTATGTKVTGTYIIALFNSNAGSSAVEIHVDGQKISGVGSIKESDAYTQEATRVENGKTIYSFKKAV